MGAYENPQMIIPPDYGEIFRRNFEAGKAQVEAAYQRAEDRRNKIKAEQQRLDDKILAFDLQRMDIKAGDLTQSLQQQTTFLADDYAENERLYSEGKISREQYNSNRISSFRKLNEMKGLAGILTQQSKEIQDVDLSEYQGGAVNGIGLMEAWKKGEIKFQYVGDEIEMYYKKGDELIAVDTQSLQEGEFFNINEKYAVSSEELKDIAGGKIIQPAHRQGQTFIGKDGKQYTRQQDQYAEGVTNEEFAEDQINSYISNSKMQKLFNNDKDAGSIYMDTVFKTMVMQNEEGNSVLTTEGERLLNKTFANSSEEEKEIIKQQIISGQYDKTNKANLDQISKRYVAEQSWNQVKGNLKSAEAVETPGKGSGTGTDASNYVDSTYSSQLSPDKRRKLTSFLEDWNAQKWQGKNTKQILESIKSQDASVFGASAGDIANKQFLTLPELNAEIQKIEKGEESFILQSSGYPLKDKQINKLKEYVRANAGKNTIIEMGVKQRKDKTEFYTMFDRNDLVFNELDGNSDNPSDIIQIIQTLPAYVGVDTNILNKEITRLLNK